MEERTTVNSQGKSSTLRTVIPSTVKKILDLKPKDKLVWQITQSEGTSEITTEIKIYKESKRE